MTTESATQSGMLQFLDRHGPVRRSSSPVRPADVFLAWLLDLPDGTDIAEAARSQIARLDGAAPLAPAASRR